MRFLEALKEMQENNKICHHDNESIYRHRNSRFECYFLNDDTWYVCEEFYSDEIYGEWRFYEDQLPLKKNKKEFWIVETPDGFLMASNKMPEAMSNMNRLHHVREI